MHKQQSYFTQSTIKRLHWRFDCLGRKSANNITSNAAAYIGCRGGSTMYFPGYIDEIRVSKTNRSADWIKLEYQNQKQSQTLVEY
jgi:hypothetical protein